MKFKKGSVRRSLRFSLIDGLFTAMMMGISENYLIPFGIALGATASQVAFLASIPLLTGAILQMESAKVTAHVGSRLKLIKVAVFFHALSWTGIVYARNPWELLAAATVFTSCGAFTVPTWQSLMSDYIPVTKRGRYFGWRNRLQGFLNVSVSILAGLLLNHFGKGHLEGFKMIFIFAMACRFFAWICLTRMEEPFRHTAHDDYFSFWDFLKGMRTRNVARFVLFAALINFCAHMSGPLMAVFLLKDLHFDYRGYMVVMTTAALSGFVFQRFWGHAADRQGNLKVIKITAWGVSLMPFAWMFSQKLEYLFVVQLFAGAFWGGFNLLVFNFLMEATTPQKRIRCISYYNVVNSAAVFLGASLGGFLLHRLPPFAGYPYLCLFLLSCFGRILVMLSVSRLVKEIR